MNILSVLCLFTMADLITAKLKQQPPQPQTLPPWRSPVAQGTVKCLLPARVAPQVDPDDCKQLAVNVRHSYPLNTYGFSQHESQEPHPIKTWIVTYGTCSMSVYTTPGHVISVRMSRIVAGFRSTYRYCLGEPYGIGGTITFDDFFGANLWLIVRRPNISGLTSAPDFGNRTIPLISFPNNSTSESWSATLSNIR